MNGSHLLASVCLHTPLAERVLRSACLSHVPGAMRIAHAYTEVLENPEIRKVDFGDYVLNVNVAEFRGIASYFRSGRQFLWFVPQLIARGDVCIDVGANMGHYTLMLATRIGSGGRVIAFEPQPFFAQLILQSAQDNGCGRAVTVDTRAVYDASGETLTLYLGRPDNSGLASIYERFYRGPLSGQQRGSGSREVTTISLTDAFAEMNVETCRLVKIDVEGAEYQVLSGARRLLEDRRIDYLVVETFPGDRAEQLLSELGYLGFRANRSLRKLTGVAAGSNEGIGDYLYVSPDLPRDRYEHIL